MWNFRGTLNPGELTSRQDLQCGSRILRLSVSVQKEVLKLLRSANAVLACLVGILGLMVAITVRVAP